MGEIQVFLIIFCSLLYFSSAFNHPPSKPVLTVPPKTKIKKRENMRYSKNVSIHNNDPSDDMLKPRGF